ncbi:MAG TPA: hypothetical protein VL992_17275 [Tepidisphaeraceae bacterium]|nr:hypothetical protein [Tepidisphaeraceae bacterium]
MTVHISSTEAASGFSDLLKRVRENGDAFIVEEGGREVCAITPINGAPKATLADLVEIFRSSPPIDEEYATTVEEYVKSVNQPKVPESPWDG